MGGEKWAGRLQGICKTILNNDLEDKVYSLWLDGKMKADLCSSEMEYCKVEKKKADKKAAKEKKKEEKRKLREASVAKKISLEEFMRRFAASKKLSPSTFTDARTEEQWYTDFLSKAGADLKAGSGATLGRDEL